MFARLLLAVAFAAGIAYWMSSGTIIVSGAAQEAEIRPPAERLEADDALFRVRVANLAAEDRRQTLTMRGQTRADALVSVAAETAGRVSERPVERGQMVTRGDILCRLDTGVREAELARTKAEEAKARLEFEAASKLQGRGFESETRVAATRAALDGAQASVAAAEQELERTIVRAPITGTIQEPLADVGSVLAIGGVCATIVDNDPMVVTGQVTERDVTKVSLGSKAAIALVTGEKVDGTVTFVSSTASTETRTFTVELRVPNPDKTLRAGVTAEAAIPLPVVRAHRLSPGVLTLNDKGAVGVRTVNEAGMVDFLPVRISGQDADGFWVTGLPETVTIITVGQDYVVEGQRVAPVVQDSAEGEPA